jgi:hypothetical protein
MKQLLSLVLAAALVGSTAAGAQVAPDAWRGVAQKVEVGSEVNVRLVDGTRFRAILLEARADAVLLQPKTRQSVPVQAVPYDAIASLERRKGGGVGAAKAAVIGVATGAGAFLAMMAIVFALVGD